MNILIVDDNETNRKLLRVTLQAEGLETVEAADGIEALNILKGGMVDAIISDLLMPNMDGLRLCHEVRASKELCRLPFIVYTNTFTSPGDERLAFDLGADKYLTKPVSTVTILEVLQESMKGASRRQPKVTEPQQELALTRVYNEHLIAKLEEKNLQLTRQTEELRQTEERSRALAVIVESSDDAIVSKTLDGTIVNWNRGAGKIYGYLADEVIGKPISILCPPERLEELKQIFESLGREERSEHIETIRLRKDGKRIHVSLTISPLKDTAGNVIGASTIARDITERKRVEEALRESEAVFRSLCESSPLGILLLDDRGQCTYANPRARAIFKVRAITVMGAGWTQHMNSADRQRHLDELVTALRDRAEYSTEFSLKLPDGNIRRVSMRTAAIRNDTGESLGHVATAEDVTEHRLTEAALHDLSHRLLKAQDGERRRIARELHDSTAQKLALLMMNLDRLNDDLVGQSKNLRKILRDSFTLVESCSQEVRTISYLLHPPLLEELGLAVALRSYIEGFKKRSGIRAKLNLPRGLKRLPAEVELALFRVVQESLGNIHRHSGSKTASIRLQRKPDRVVLEVQDKGCGLSSRKPTEPNEKPETLGVGIAGMTERLRQLAGQLEIISGKRGTTVRATVPLENTEK